MTKCSSFLVIKVNAIVPNYFLSAHTFVNIIIIIIIIINFSNAVAFISTQWYISFKKNSSKITWTLARNIKVRLKQNPIFHFIYAFNFCFPTSFINTKLYIK
uniref:Uncharacterized protein n=1 Tax=Octopus bimaculoides TaxID=37653 RepID=A0A0L8H4E6_OCTBM